MRSSSVVSTLPNTILHTSAGNCDILRQVSATEVTMTLCLLSLSEMEVFIPKPHTSRQQLTFSSTPRLVQPQVCTLTQPRWKKASITKHEKSAMLCIVNNQLDHYLKMLSPNIIDYRKAKFPGTPGKRMCVQLISIFQASKILLFHLPSIKPVLGLTRH